MKHKPILILVCALLLLPKVMFSQFSIRIYGAGNWIGGGDLNRDIKSWNSYYSDRNKNPYSFQYDVRELHILWEGGAEVIYDISSRSSIILGLGFLRGATEGKITSHFSQKQDYHNSPFDFGTVNIDEQSQQQPEYHLQAIPVSITLNYSFPLGDKGGFFFGAGGGYYFGKLRYSEVYQYNFDYSDDKDLSGSFVQFVDQYQSSGVYSEESTCRTIGLHVKGGLELKIGENLFFFIEALGRRAHFGNWKGSKKDAYNWTHTWGFWGANSDKGSLDETSDGKLWMGELMSDETGKSYGLLVFSEEEPTSLLYTMARPAKIDLDGFSLRIGIKINL